MATGKSRKRKRIILLPIQLSELFTYPNDNAFRDGKGVRIIEVGLYHAYHPFGRFTTFEMKDYVTHIAVVDRRVTAI